LEREEWVKAAAGVPYVLQRIFIKLHIAAKSPVDMEMLNITGLNDFPFGGSL